MLLIISSIIPRYIMMFSWVTPCWELNSLYFHEVSLSTRLNMSSIDSLIEFIFFKLSLYSSTCFLYSASLTAIYSSSSFYYFFLSLSSPKPWFLYSSISAFTFEIFSSRSLLSLVRSSTNLFSEKLRSSASMKFFTRSSISSTLVSSVIFLNYSWYSFSLSSGIRHSTLSFENPNH